ncbi:addiction module antidote protein [Lasius niger]|uniref:Addiction module antidote protein n=1 Tax=Lasius niger TaxID=67767 RepID=A0A0J7K8Q8_LASNI|nr:addiction module antidote protein [Lasius niger]
MGKESGASLTGDQPTDNIAEIGVSLTRDLLTDNTVEPVAGTSRSSSRCTSRSSRPVRYRSVAKEVGTGPKGEILMRNVLVAIGESEASEGEADQRVV